MSASEGVDYFVTKIVKVVAQKRAFGIVIIVSITVEKIYIMNDYTRCNFRPWLIISTQSSRTNH